MTSQTAARRDLCLPGRRTSRVSFRMARGDRRGGRTDRAAPAVDRLARDLRSPLAPARDHRAGDRPAGGPRDAARRAAAGRDAAAAAADDRAGWCHSSQRSCRGRRTPCANPTRCRCAQSHPAAPMSLMPCGSLPSRETARSTPGSTRWTTGFQGATRALISSISSSSRRSTPFASIRTSFACSTHRPSCWRGHRTPGEWISYGIVVDRDGDGSPDGQVGLDNIPGGFFRAWYTEPFTGHQVLPGLERDGGRRLRRVGDADGRWRDAAWPRLPMDCSGLAGSIDNRHGNFYLWAALIRDGQLVSVDYAPDVGWLAVPEKR